MDLSKFIGDLDPRFKAFHELMAYKVKDILLVSSLYDACLIEEDCRLAERIINEYRGLNLSKPPRITWVSSAEKALAVLDEKPFDIVITMPRLSDMDAFAMGRRIKEKDPNLPIILLAHQAIASECHLEDSRRAGIDRMFVWAGNADLLLAMIKSVEDRRNVERDTIAADVRVIIFVEDNPVYMSSVLPILYREVVSQTQAVFEERLTEEDRLLAMRARAKILVAENYEEAWSLYEQFKPFVLGVISDVRFPRKCVLEPEAGINLLSKIKREISDIPMLLTSSESANRKKAELVPADFVDKNSPSLHTEIRKFFLDRLGFGDFVFRMPDGREVGRVSTIRNLEKFLPTIPDESFTYHFSHNDFSRWLFARTEFDLASYFRPITSEDFGDDIEKIRQFMISKLRARRKARQQGVVVDFDLMDFDLDTDLVKIGKGSLGGKARGLAFITTMLRRNPGALESFSNVDIIIPRSLIITTEYFDRFLETNELRYLSKVNLPDSEIGQQFLNARFPDDLSTKLKAYLNQATYPLAVRSSGLLEDAQFRAYAGLYRTYMIPNNEPDPEIRLNHLTRAIKLVWASTYFQGPKAFAQRVGQRTEEEKMGIIIQELIGEHHGDYFYPAVSGVAQSHNYYPFSRMKPEDGIATIALGLGRTVVEGGLALRFSPIHPQILPQFSAVDDILRNSQRYFYALKMDGPTPELNTWEESALSRREISDATDESPIKMLSSTYIPAEHRLRDSAEIPGPKVVTFAQVLKYKTFPLCEILINILEIAHEGMGAPVEIEFTSNLDTSQGSKPVFALLQVRPMSARAEMMEVELTEKEIRRAFCYSGNALGNTSRRDISDIVYVKPDVFDPVKTIDIAAEIGRLNALFSGNGNHQYLLIGPGRWGSADRWLGIPVSWADISAVSAIVETTAPSLKAEPSQGSHFFHNVTTLGISYLHVTDAKPDHLDWSWLSQWPVTSETNYVAHIRLERPVTLKVDGRRSMGIIYQDDESV